MKTITLQFAMQIEAEPILKSFNAEAIPSPVPHYPFRFYSAKTKTLQLIFGVAGPDRNHGVDSIGTVPAALLAETLISHFKPALMLNAGTAGGFESKQAQISKIYLGYPQTAFHSRRIAIPHFEAYASGNYQTADILLMNQKMNYAISNVSTGDALDFSKEDALMISKNNSGVKEMEAAAIGWVCEHHRIPLMPVKVITDFVDHPTETAIQFFQNYERAVEELKNAILRIVDYLEAHPEDPVWKHHSAIDQS
jgi:5'-methylthioadenosine nucleosidase